MNSVHILLLLRVIKVSYQNRQGYITHRLCFSIKNGRWRERATVDLSKPFKELSKSYQRAVYILRQSQLECKCGELFDQNLALHVHNSP